MARRQGRTRSRGVKETASTSAPADQVGQTGDQIGARLGAHPGDGHCALCERAVERFTVHHLVPRARGGNHGPTARLCSTCHRQVHALFSETALAEELYSVELLRANPKVASFLRWMRKQRGGTFRVRRARERG